jgi:hypothetical protein
LNKVQVIDVNAAHEHKWTYKATDLHDLITIMLTEHFNDIRMGLPQSLPSVIVRFPISAQRREILNDATCDGMLALVDGPSQRALDFAVEIDPEAQAARVSAGFVPVQACVLHTQGFSWAQNTFSGFVLMWILVLCAEFNGACLGNQRMCAEHQLN